MLTTALNKPKEISVKKYLFGKGDNDVAFNLSLKLAKLITVYVQQWPSVEKVYIIVLKFGLDKILQVVHKCVKWKGGGGFMHASLVNINRLECNENKLNSAFLGYKVIFRFFTSEKRPKLFLGSFHNKN